jgi:hypothetical protein
MFWAWEPQSGKTAFYPTRTSGTAPEFAPAQKDGSRRKPDPAHESFPAASSCPRLGVKPALEEGAKDGGVYRPPVFFGGCFQRGKVGGDKIGNVNRLEQAAFPLSRF